MRNTRLICCLLTALALIASPALAAITVRVVDLEGAPASGVDLTAYHADGWVVAKVGPQESGVFSIPGYAGDKLSFDVGSPAMGWSLGVERTAGPTGNIIIMLGPAPPANDLCEDATEVLPGGSASGSTADATFDNAGTCGVTNTAPGVWHTVTGTGTSLTLSLANSDYDTKLSVYCGSCDDLTCIDGDDDGGPGLTSELTFCSQAGVSYSILVHGFGSNTGNYELTVTDTGAGCSPEVNCVAAGACCSCLNPPFNCTEETEAECAAQGSDYLGDNSACVSEGADVVYVATPGLPINDLATTSDTISVTEDFLVGDVDVDIVITHTWVADLEITLTDPDGFAVPLWFDACGSNDDLDIILDDDGNNVVCAEPTIGVVDPESVGGGDLGDFENTGSLGNWTLSVFDDAGGDTGTLVQWSLHIAPGTPACPDLPVCGNGILEDGEDCDDGNNVSGDGCSANCCLEGPGGGDDEDEDEDEDDDNPGS